MLAATILGVLLGMWPTIRRGRPAWWKALAIVAVIGTIVLSLAPPTAGTLTDAIIVARAQPNSVVPVLVTVTDVSNVPDSTQTYSATVHDARTTDHVATLYFSSLVKSAIDEIGGRPTVVHVRRLDSDLAFHAEAIGPSDPFLTLPYIPGLEERARIMYYHVPMSWVALVLYIVAMVESIIYLRKRRPEADRLAASAASVGTLYTILATLTGAVWAKYNWGAYWNWDPKQTSIFLTMLIYAAYFVLRSSIDDTATRARLSAVYAIVASVAVPFLFFILPRLMPGLHPGSSDDTTAGPMLSLKSDTLNPTKQVIFSLSLFAFSLVAFWLVNLRFRLGQLEHVEREEAQP